MCAGSRFDTVSLHGCISITNGYPGEDGTGSAVKECSMKLVNTNSLRVALTLILTIASGASLAGCPSIEGEWRSIGALPDGRAYACNVVVDKGGVLLPPSNCIVYDDLGNRVDGGDAQGVWSVAEGDGICRTSSNVLIRLTTVTEIDGRVDRKGDVISSVAVLSGFLSGTVTNTWHRMSNK